MWRLSYCSQRSPQKPRGHVTQAPWRGTSESSAWCRWRLVELGCCKAMAVTSSNAHRFFHPYSSHLFRLCQGHKCQPWPRGTPFASLIEFHGFQLHQQVMLARACPTESPRENQRLQLAQKSLWSSWGSGCCCWGFVFVVVLVASPRNAQCSIHGAGCQALVPPRHQTRTSSHQGPAAAEG